MGEAPDLRPSRSGPRQEAAARVAPFDVVEYFDRLYSEKWAAYWASVREPHANDPADRKHEDHSEPASHPKGDQT
jgi:hypothetical protein